MSTPIGYNEKDVQAKEEALEIRMSRLADQWREQANDKETYADRLRREELALRTEIVGLRRAASGVLEAMEERQAAEKANTQIVITEQDQRGEPTEIPVHYETLKR